MYGSIIHRQAVPWDGIHLDARQGKKAGQCIGGRAVFILGGVAKLRNADLAMNGKRGM